MNQWKAFYRYLFTEHNCSEIRQIRELKAETAMSRRIRELNAETAMSAQPRFLTYGGHSCSENRFNPLPHTPEKEAF